MELMGDGRKLVFEYWQFALSIGTTCVLVVVFLYGTFASRADMESKESRDSAAISEIKSDIREIKNDIKDILRNSKK